MKRILVIGSINFDEVYSVTDIVIPGQTISCSSYNRYLGGKGNNQAIALARAGASVSFGGKCGSDGKDAVDFLASCGVDTDRIGVSSAPTGRAIIQVDRRGENSIIVYGGANRDIGLEDLEEILRGWGEGDSVLFQNEISSLAEAIALAHDRGLRVYLNPSPADSVINSLPLDLVDCLILNSLEASLISGLDERRSDALVTALVRKFPETEILVTLGAKGSLWSDGTGESVRMGAASVSVVDTTAAGDTFTGYFIAARLRGESPEKAMREASAAAGLCVTCAGAVPSIPERQKVLEALQSGSFVFSQAP